MAKKRICVVAENKYLYFAVIKKQALGTKCRYLIKKGIFLLKMDWLCNGWLKMLGGNLV